MTEFEFKGMEDLKKQLIGYLQSAEAKEDFKKMVIDFLSDEDSCGYFEMDGITRDMLTKDDWKEIAKAVGEDITVVGDMVFANSGIGVCDFYNRYKA